MRAHSERDAAQIIRRAREEAELIPDAEQSAWAERRTR
jgi:hypothetical protein